MNKAIPRVGIELLEKLKIKMTLSFPWKNLCLAIQSELFRVTKVLSTQSWADLDNIVMKDE